MDESCATQNRRHDRSNVLLRATVETPSASHSVVLRNLSQEGALVQGEGLPPEGTAVLFHRQGLCVPARVAWSHCACAGLAFEMSLYPRELLRHVPKPESQAPLPIKRRPGLGAQPLSEAERAMIERWATESSHRLGE
ncbi:MAG TPA: PilZ domain-containing protein [Sphingomicrobium sp.]|nr:PilZ domain-containing protein [Sphingomicrobium sp.]